MNKAGILKLSIVILIFYTVFAALDSIVGNIIRKESPTKQHQILNITNQNFDFVVLGSSRAFSGANINLIEKEFNVNGLNLGCSGIGIAEQKLLFQKFIEKNSTKLLCLQVDYTSLNSDLLKNPFNQYLYFPYMGDTIVDYALAEETAALRYILWKYIPLFRYAEYNSEYRKMIFSNTLNYQLEENSGYLAPKKRIIDMKDHKIPAFYKSAKNVASTEIQIKQKDFLHLIKISEICRLNDIKLFLYTSPEYIENKKEYEETLLPVVSAFKNINKASYTNWYNEEFCSFEENFTNDKVHLSPSFVDEFSLILGAQIIKKLNQ